MGKKKRSHGEAMERPDQYGHNKHSKKSHKTTPQAFDESANPNGSIPVHLSQGGQPLLVGEKNLQREAKEWLIAALSLLRGLEEKPDLSTACASIVGEEVMQTASSLRKAISLKRSAISIADHGLHLLQRPPIGKKLGVDYRMLPPLPEVHDSELARRVFRHKSTLTDNEVKSGDMTLDYERLEFQGDSYLHVLSTRFLCTRYPNLNEGQLSHLREGLLCNETLAQFSLRYGLDEHIQISKNFTSTGSKSTIAQTKWTKILGDVFEAYVAAVIESRPSDGFAVVEDWLQVLWNHRLPDEESLEVRKTAKGDLADKVMSKGIKLRYEETKPRAPVEPGRELYTMGVFITGWGLERALLGEGTGLSKGEAGQKAADNALLNSTTTQVSLTKRRFAALWKEEQGREGGPRQEVLDKLEADWK